MPNRQIRTARAAFSRRVRERRETLGQMFPSTAISVQYLKYLHHKVEANREQIALLEAAIRRQQ